MKKKIFNLTLASFALIAIISCDVDDGAGGGGKAITDFMPKLGSKNLTTQTGYNIFDGENIKRSIKANKKINRAFTANSEDKKFVLEVLNHIIALSVSNSKEVSGINILISNIDAPDYQSAVNDMYSIFKVNNITTSSTKETIRTFMNKISKDTYDENALKLKSVIDFSKTIDCATTLNLSNAYTFDQSFINNNDVIKDIKETKDLIKKKENELVGLGRAISTREEGLPEGLDDSASPEEIEEEKKGLREYIADLKNSLESSKNILKNSSKTAIESALSNIYAFEHYECVTSEQLQFGGEIDIKPLGDNTFTKIENTFENSLYRVSWLNKGKLTESFFGDLTLRLSNHQKLANNYEDYTRLDSKILADSHQKLYSIFLRSSNGASSQTFYNIELDPRVKLPKNQYIKFFKTFDKEGTQASYLIYSHFNALGVSLFGCATIDNRDCSNQSNYSSIYAKFTSSDASIRAKAKTPVNSNDSAKNFFDTIDQDSAKELGLITDLSSLITKISSVPSSDMSSLLSKVGTTQDNSFYVEDL